MKSLISLIKNFISSSIPTFRTVCRWSSIVMGILSVLCFIAAMWFWIMDISWAWASFLSLFWICLGIMGLIAEEEINGACEEM